MRRKLRIIKWQRTWSCRTSFTNAQDKLVGGLHLPNDETGDCYLFTNALAQIAKELGVNFQFNQNVEKLIVEGDQIKGVQVNGKVLTADRYVLAFGSYSRDFLKPLDLQLPVYPVKVTR